MPPHGRWHNDLSVRPSVRALTYEHDNLKKTNFLKIGTSGLPGEDVKRSTLEVRRSKVEVRYDAEVRFGDLAEA